MPLQTRQDGPGEPPPVLYSSRAAGPEGLRTVGGERPPNRTGRRGGGSQNHDPGPIACDAIRTPHPFSEALNPHAHDAGGLQ